MNRSTILTKVKFYLPKALLALLMLMGGAGKLSGSPELHQIFSQLGLPSWFGYFIGACEVAGAIGLFIAPLSALAASGLAIIMLGAIYYHVTLTPVQEGIPALVALLLAIATAQQMRPYAFRLKRADKTD